MKETAVEWLFKQLCSEKLSWNKDSNGKLFFDKTSSDILQQAKEMEKEQMKIYQIKEELYNKLPVALGVNCISFKVKEHRYFANKYYIDNFKGNFKPETNETL